MASISASLPVCLDEAIDNNGFFSADVRTQPDAPASLYSSLPFHPSDLASVTSQPSQLDITQDSILQRVAQLAEQIQRHSTSLSPSSAEVLALRETSPSSTTATRPPRAVTDSYATSSYEYTIHNMMRKSDKATSSSRASGARHMRTRRSKQLDNEPEIANHQTTFENPVVPTSSLRQSDTILTMSDTDGSSALSSPPSSPESVPQKLGVFQRLVPSVPDAGPRSHYSTGRFRQDPLEAAQVKRQKRFNNDSDGEDAMIDEAYYSRRPSLEDEYKQITEAAEASDSLGRRTRRDVGTGVLSTIEASSPDLALVNSRLEPSSKRKPPVGERVGFQSAADAAELRYDNARSNPLAVFGNSHSDMRKPSGARLETSSPSSGAKGRQPKERSKTISALRQYEESGKGLTQARTQRPFTRDKSSGPRKLAETHFAADGEALYRPDSEAGGSPARSGRGGTRGGRGRGGAKNNGSRGGGNGNGGRGRPKGKRGGGDDDPEPPQRKSLTEEEEEQVRRLKQRQQELKKLFATVGAHQTDLLDLLASRDLNKLIKKARAHTKVPEYEELKNNLKELMEAERKVTRTKYDVASAAEMERYEREKELIETQFKQRCEETRTEHLQGLQGDMISLRKAHATALDDTRTETGSEVDYFPRYHEIPEADAHVRGYTSSKVTDERPFKQYFESRGDHDLQDIINEDITGPMMKSIQQQNEKDAEEKRIQQTQTMEALSTEATKELREMKSRVAARRATNNDAYALCLLADVSSHMAQRPPQQNYGYMPCGPNEHFPGNAVGPQFSQANGRALAPAPTSFLPQQIPVTTVPSKRSRNRSKASTSSISSVPPLRPALHLQTSMNGAPTPSSSAPQTPISQPHIVSTGPGQVIAPAPPKPLTTPVMQHSQSPFRRPSFSASQRYQGYPFPPPPSSMPQQYGPPLPSHHHRQHSTSGPSSVPASPRTMPSPRSSGPPTGHQFVFQPPSGMTLPMSMPASPRPGANPNPFGGDLRSPISGPSQGKIPVTFVNQTIASRKAAAAAKARRKDAGDSENDRKEDGPPKERRESGGVRMLLPKQ